MVQVAGHPAQLRRADVQVAIGIGGRCRIQSVSASAVVCVTAAAPDVSVSSAVTLKLKVRGVAAAQMPVFTFDLTRTAILTGAAWTSQGISSWTLEVAGSNLDAANTTVHVGPSPCLVASQTATKVRPPAAHATRCC